MWLITLPVVAILILNSSPCDGAETTKTVKITRTKSPVSKPPPAQAARIFPRRANDDSMMTYNVGDTSYVSLWDKLLDPLSNVESTEEQQGYTYNTYYNVPATVNFHDIYSNKMALLSEDPVLTTAKEEEIYHTTMTDDKSFHLNNIKTNFVEFHPKTQTMPPSTIPPPIFFRNSSFIKTALKTTTTTTSTTSTSTTEEPEEEQVHVIPIKKDYQKGLLDLLFPAVRVRTFKAVFDTFRRIMSHTFR